MVAVLVVCSKVCAALNGDFCAAREGKIMWMRTLAIIGLGTSTLLAANAMNAQPVKPSRPINLTVESGSAGMASGDAVTVSAIMNIAPGSIKSAVWISPPSSIVVEIRLSAEIAEKISTGLRNAATSADSQQAHTETIDNFLVMSVESESGWVVGISPKDRGIRKPLAGASADARDLADRIDTARSNIAWIETRVAALQN